MQAEVSLIKDYTAGPTKFGIDRRLKFPSSIRQGRGGALLSADSPPCRERRNGTVERAPRAPAAPLFLPQIL